MDLVAIVATLLFAIDLVMKDWLNNPNPLIHPLIIVYGIPVANIVWLQLRLGSRMPSLAFRPRREELALTFIPARDYLAGQLKWPLIRALTPTCIIWSFLAVYGINILGQLGDMSLIVIIGLFCTTSIITSLALSTGGVFDLLVRQCRAKSVGSASCYIIPLVWSTVACAAMAAIFSLFVLGIMSYNPQRFSFLIHAFNLLFAVSLTVFTLILWRKAIALFKIRGGVSYCFVIPIVWSFFFITPIALTLCLGWPSGRILAELIWDEGKLIPLLFFAPPILAALAIIFAIKRWRKAVEVYYYFD